MLALLNLLKQLFLQTKLKPGLCDIPMVDASTHLELLGFIQTFTGLQKPPAVAFFGKVCIGDIDQTRAFWKARTQKFQRPKNQNGWQSCSLWLDNAKKKLDWDHSKTFYEVYQTVSPLVVQQSLTR